MASVHRGRRLRLLHRGAFPSTRSRDLIPKLVVTPASEGLAAWARRGCHARSAPAGRCPLLLYRYVPSPTAEWELFPVEYVKADLEHVPLVSDPVTGMMVLKMVYRAGFTNLWHSNPAPTRSTS